VPANHHTRGHQHVQGVLNWLPAIFDEDGKDAYLEGTMKTWTLSPPDDEPYVEPITVVQLPGDVVYLPPGWHHEVSILSLPLSHATLHYSRLNHGVGPGGDYRRIDSYQKMHHAGCDFGGPHNRGFLYAPTPRGRCILATCRGSRARVPRPRETRTQR
jgi:hypothetical protein